MTAGAFEVAALGRPSARLPQRGADLREGGTQLGAHAVDCRDNRERDAGRDQAVFDGGSAGFVGKKFAKHGHG